MSTKTSSSLTDPRTIRREKQRMYEVAKAALVGAGYAEQPSGLKALTFLMLPIPLYRWSISRRELRDGTSNTLHVLCRETDDQSLNNALCANYYSVLVRAYEAAIGLDEAQVFVRLGRYPNGWYGVQLRMPDRLTLDRLYGRYVND